MRLPFFDPYTEDFYQDSNEWNTLHLDEDQIGKVEQHGKKAGGVEGHASESAAIEIELPGEIDERIAALVRREVQRALQAAAQNSQAASGTQADFTGTPSGIPVEENVPSSDGVAPLAGTANSVTNG